VVGAPQRDRALGGIRDVGAAYLFRSSADGSAWTYFATLDPNDDASANRMFGFSVSVYSNATLARTRVLVGAPGAAAISGIVPRAGAGYLYTVSTTTLVVTLEVQYTHPLAAAAAPRSHVLTERTCHDGCSSVCAPHAAVVGAVLVCVCLFHHKMSRKTAHPSPPPPSTHAHTSQARLEDPIGALTGDQFGYAVNVRDTNALVCVDCVRFGTSQPPYPRGARCARAVRLRAALPRSHRWTGRRAREKWALGRLFFV
jgi:hypothetical protein